MVTKKQNELDKLSSYVVGSLEQIEALLKLSYFQKVRLFIVMTIAKKRSLRTVRKLLGKWKEE